jgi:hypothetical protein
LALLREVDMSGVFGGKKKSTTDQTQSTNTQLDQSGSTSSFSDSLSSAFSSGLESALSQIFGRTSSSGTTANSSTSGFQNTSGGTSSSTSTRNPWEFAAPTLQQALQQLTGANAGALDPIQAAANRGVDYASAAFGGVPNLNLGDTTSAIRQILQGGATGAAGGSSDAAGAALTRMLSGTPDYEGVQGAIDAANAPILRQLEQDVIPGLNSRATFLNNPTGGIKTLNRVLPEVGERMSQNATAITDAERRRALDAQTTGLGLFGSLSGQANAQALQAAGLAPELLKMGLLPSQLEGEAAGLPLSLAERFASSTLPFAGVGGSDTTTGTTQQTGSGTQTGSNTGTSTSDTTSQQSQQATSQNFQQNLQQVIQQLLGQTESSTTGSEESHLRGTTTTKSGGLGSVLGGLLSLGSLLIPGMQPLAMAGGLGSALLGGSPVPGTRNA